MSQTLQLHLLLRILVGFAMGAIIGLEREQRGKAAGLRTHTLVAGGSAIFAVASAEVFEAVGQGRDPGRIAAQIVTGIGFLGAGAIIRSGGSVSGLTTAAGIWVAAAIGILAGGGAYTLAVGSTLLTVVSLRLPHKWKRRKPRREDDDLSEEDRPDVFVPSENGELDPLTRRRSTGLRS